MEYKYYLYRHIRLDKNEPFYIGIGTKRCNFISEYERAFCKSNRNKHWRNIVNKTNYIVEILYEANNLDEIRAKEIEFIKLYGRRDKNEGCLVNFTDGGDGSKGRALTDEHKRAIGRAAKMRIGVKLTEEHKKKLSEAHKGKPSNRRGIPHSCDTKIKMSNKAKERCAKGENYVFTKEDCLRGVEIRKRKVECCKISTGEINIFNSMTEASKFTGVPHPNIIKVCQLKRKSGKGYTFKYVD